jgi:hypothetical protein
MLSVLSNDPLNFLPNTFGNQRSSMKDDPFTPELIALRRDLGTLALACTDIVTKTAQHYYGEDSWVIGTMPGYSPLADTVEATSRNFLINTNLSQPQTEIVSNTMKMSTDLRTAARGARQAVQIAFLFKAERIGGSDALNLLIPMAETAALIAEHTASTIQTGQSGAATQAAQAYRTMDALRIQVETGICSHQWDDFFSPTQLKMIRAAAWNFAIVGESMARVAARLVL